MYKIVFIILAIILISSCSKKTLPVITSRPSETIKPEQLPSNVSPDTATGRIVFMNRCARCHDLPKPSDYTTKRWEGILSYMIPRARLDADQAVHITAYLKSNAVNE